MRGKNKREEGNLFQMRCKVCSRQLERTPSGYLACPLGHGRLKTEAQVVELFGPTNETRPLDSGLYE